MDLLQVGSEALKDLKRVKPAQWRLPNTMPLAQSSFPSLLLQHGGYHCFTLKERCDRPARIIGKIDARFAKKTHKFGIAPSSCQPAPSAKEARKPSRQMDKENGDTDCCLVELLHTAEGDEKRCSSQSHDSTS
jgi:hypothetical protein